MNISRYKLAFSCESDVKLGFTYVVVFNGIYQKRTFPGTNWHFVVNWA